MSFSSEIKDEVAKIKVEDYKIILSELAGITPMCGILNFKNNKISMEYITENAPVARRIFTFLMLKLKMLGPLNLKKMYLLSIYRKMSLAGYFLMS